VDRKSLAIQTVLDHEQFLLLFHKTGLHVGLEEADWVDLSDKLKLVLKLVVLQLVSLDCLLDKRNVRREVKS
jgi:hypothetical protein